MIREHTGISGPNLVETSHHGDIRLVVSHHGGGDIGGGNDVGLGLDSRLDDLGVEGVGDQRDDNIVLSDGSIQSDLIVNIQRDGGGVGVASSKLLGDVETSSGYN